MYSVVFYPVLKKPVGTRYRPPKPSLQRLFVSIVRNATEANNAVCNGLDLKPGDEVLLTDQEHPGGRCCWEQKAMRFGVKLNYVALPKPPASRPKPWERNPAS